MNRKNSLLQFNDMEAQTATGMSFDAEFAIWGYSLWGDNEFAAHIAEGYNFELLHGSGWDWAPRTGVVSTFMGEPVPKWWRLPYVVKQYGDKIAIGGEDA